MHCFILFLLNINNIDQIQYNFGIPEWKHFKYSGKVHTRLEYSYETDLPLEIGKKYMDLSKHMITVAQRDHLRNSTPIVCQVYCMRCIAKHVSHVITMCYALSRLHVHVK